MNRELVLLIIVALLFFTFLYLVPVVYWLMARYTGVKVSLFRLIVMRLKRVSVKKIINAQVLAKKGNINIDHQKLESHHLSGGDVTNIVLGLIAAKTANIPLSLHEAIQQDMEGINIFEKIKKLAEGKNH